jgi:hypothetical protein
MEFKTAADLKAQLTIILSAVLMDDGTTQNELGTYSRPPPLVNIPAIRVNDRPMDGKMLVRAYDKPLIPSLEVVIQNHPDFNQVGRNWAHRNFEELYQLYLIFHDPRQDTRTARRAIIRNYRSAGEFVKIGAGDSYREQYTITIYTPTTIKDKYYA